MKFLKKIFYFIAFLIIALCIGIMVFALNPSLTQKLADFLYGGKNVASDSGNGNSNEEHLYLPDINNAGIDASKIPFLTENGYILPEEEVIVPATVDGKNDYKQIEQVANEISDEESKAYAADYGVLNETPDFPADIYPYYAMLNGDMQTLYRQIYSNAMATNLIFQPLCDVTVSELKNVFEAVYNDHPELFWLETEFSCKYTNNGKVAEIALKYNATADYLEEAKENFNKAATLILDVAKRFDGVAEKEKYVHDALVSTIEYDKNATMNQSAYSALVNKRTVCAGYARGFQYLMQQLNVPCYYCSGFSGEDHAWDIMAYENGFVNVDVTWDDTDPSTYDYYNKTDEEFSTSHVRTGLSIYLPACNAAKSPVMAPITSNLSAKEDTEEKKDIPEPEIDKKQKDLEEAGITEQDVVRDLESYYENCKTQIKIQGAGNKQFSNVIPETLWNAIEVAYNEGAYRSGYVDECLKELNKEYFAIQISPVRLGGGYYRIYHSTAIW